MNRSRTALSRPDHATWRAIALGLLLSIPLDHELDVVSQFISWLVKRMLLRHGGISAYRKAIPFFLGLALGDYFIGGMWDILGVALHKYVYKFWH